MSGVLSNNVKSHLLDAMLRATAPTAAGQIGQILLCDSAGVGMRYKNITSANWGAPSNGQIALSVPALTTYNAAGNGTISKATFYDGGINASILVSVSLTAGVSSGTQDIVVDNASSSVGSTNNVTDCRIRWDSSLGTVKLSTTLRNKLLDTLVGRNSAHFTAAGTIDVYTGSAPGADNAATGTKLVSFTTSSTTWSGAISGACSLAASLNATAIASGTAGYARFTWNDGTNTYVIEGSIGTSGTDFVINNTTINSGTSYTLSAATMAP